MNKIKMSLVVLALFAMPFCVKATETPFTAEDCAAIDILALATGAEAAAGEWKVTAANTMESFGDDVAVWANVRALDHIGLEEAKGEKVKYEWRNLTGHVTEANKAKFKITDVKASCYRTDDGDDADEEDELTKGYVQITVTGPAKYGTRYMFVAFSK